MTNLGEIIKDIKERSNNYGIKLSKDILSDIETILVHCNNSNIKYYIDDSCRKFMNDDYLHTSFVKYLIYDYYIQLSNEV